MRLRALSLGTCTRVSVSAASCGLATQSLPAASPLLHLVRLLVVLVVGALTMSGGSASVPSVEMLRSCQELYVRVCLWHRPRPARGPVGATQCMRLPAPAACLPHPGHLQTAQSPAQGMQRASGAGVCVGGGGARAHRLTLQQAAWLNALESMVGHSCSVRAAPLTCSKVRAALALAQSSASTTSPVAGVSSARRIAAGFGARADESGVCCLLCGCQGPLAMQVVVLLCECG